MCTINNTGGTPFGPDGCQVPVGKGTCGETRTLEIINEFKRLYEEKLHEIDTTGGGDCLQEKIKLQQDWIGDLTEQNEMLIRAVEELEHEATERVHILEEKLHQSAQCICEVMKKYREYDVTNDLLAEPLQKQFYLENDQKNLLEFIRRIRDEKEWNVHGLKFYEISYQDLFGSNKLETDYFDDNAKNEYINQDVNQEQMKVKDRECTISGLQSKLDFFNSFGNVEVISKELKCKKEECETLKKTMEDTQQALVEEVATKHDQIIQLKREVQQLEERCIQADKQTAFRDDIIKELRKEIKQLKQQKCVCVEQENNSLKSQVDTLQKKNACLECNISEGRGQIEKLEKDFNTFLKDKDESKRRLKTSERKCKDILDENNNLKIENNKLKNETENLNNTKNKLEHELKSVAEEIENFKCKSVTCSCKLDELAKENEKLMKEMVKLNEENRNLLNTIDNQRKRIDRATRLTQEEIVHLNATIDELQTSLQKSKHLQDEEEKRNQLIVLELNETIQQLKHDLNMAQEKFEKEVKICKICKGRSKVGFAENAEVQASLDEGQLEKQKQTIQKKDEVIKVQNDTLNLIQIELESIKQKESVMRDERDKKHHETLELKDKIHELENALQDCEGKAANLQMAVDLYLNTINVLEASEEKYKIEIDQQKSTIINLQGALVAAKHELDELKQKSEDNEAEQHRFIHNFSIVISDIETEKQNFMEKYKDISEEYEHLQDMNFDLEVEHCNSLQDVDILEYQLHKYKKLLKSYEEENSKFKHNLKKLMKQKKCYEEVVVYFKEEMCLMAEQLNNLQQLLTLSNETAQEETCKLMQAFLNVQTTNEKLATQLSAAEQKVLLENQMNQLHEAKICELEQIISEREIDLSRHDQAILNIRQTLQCSLEQNEDLHTTIVALNDTILQLQNAIKVYEVENCRSKENTLLCQSQINCCKERLQELKSTLDRKTTELLKLEMAYNNQNRILKCAQQELKEMKDRQNDRQCHMKCTIENLREKLAKAEEKYSELSNEFDKLQNQLGVVTRREAVKDMEVKRYRKIIGDLKNTLIDLNKNLTNKDLQNKDFQNKCKNAECRKNMELIDEAKNQDICLNCPCEVEFYQSIVETLKKSVIDLKKRLTETQKKNQQLEKENKTKDSQLSELSKTQYVKDKEYNDLRKKFEEKLKQAQAEECRYSELATQFEKELGSIRQELEVKTLQLDDVKKSAQEISSSRCVQLACAQEEVNSLKEELNRLLRKHCALNVENEKLHSQSARMQSTVASLEEKSQLLKGQLEQYISELQSVQNEKETLVQKNQELLAELRTVQCSYATASKQQRTNQCSYTPKPQKSCIRNLTPCLKHVSISPPPVCQSPWSLGSQGTVSVCDTQSPSRSPCLNEECDWYSSTFRNESDDDEEEDWVSKVEDLAAQVRKTNKMWKSKLEQSDYSVSKDKKK